MISVVKPVIGWLAWRRKRMSITIEPSAPTSMSGLRTRSWSESTPNTMRATVSAPQNQALRPLACRRWTG